MFYVLILFMLFTSNLYAEVYVSENVLAGESGYVGANLTNNRNGAQTVNGIGFQYVYPPDTVGDVGPNHYVQMVNSAFAIYNKDGSLLAGPYDINTLWSGQGNHCERTNDGDPVVLYDSMADRWFLSQLSLPNGNGTGPWYMCIAISETPEPTGKYYLYEFQVNDDVDHMPDYPKFAVWPDAYYMTTNDSPPSVGVFAFNREKMLNGEAASYQKFSVRTNLLLPADLDGQTPPPSGSAGYFYTMMDDSFWPAYGFNGQDRLEIYEFKVDFNNSSNSTFTKTIELPLTPYEYTVCGYFNLPCINQPKPGEKLDAISEWPMWRFVYRNFGNHESLIGNFTVDTDGKRHAGIRWFELRKTATSNNWELYQEATHAPDAMHRWLGSIAMDGKGNIALGYSVSSHTMNPAIRYAVRLSTDTIGTLQEEMTIVDGPGVQVDGSNRWGDYSSMNIDPADDCTFWYTNEYYEQGAMGWSTKISSFQIPGCMDSGSINFLAAIDVTGNVYYTKNLSSWTPIAGSLATLISGDFNGDGSVDLAGLSESGLVFYTINLTSWQNIPGVLSYITSGDLNADGRDDLVGLTSGGYIFYTTDLKNWQNIPGTLFELTLGDIDGNATDDIVGLSASGGIFYTVDLKNWGQILGSLAKLALGHINNDGLDDVIGLSSTGNLYYCLDKTTWNSLSGQLASIHIGDVNGDGVDDIVGINKSGKLWYTVDVQTFKSLNNASSVATITLGDINGDGRGDVAGVNTDGQVFYTIDFKTIKTLPTENIVFTGIVTK